MLQNRNIALCIVLTIITCGIYGLYWLVVLNDDINYVTNEPNAMTGGMVLLLTIVTCGIYGWYWMYTKGEKLDKVDGSTNSGILFIILGILGLSVVTYALMQERLNNISGNPQA